MPASSPVLFRARRGGGTTNHFLHGSQRQCDIDLSPLLPLLRSLLAPRAKAEDAPKDVKGLYLMSDYPAVTLRPGETSTDQSAVCRITDLPPERLSLSVSGVPTGWTATLMGGGQPVAAAMPATECQRFARIAARRAEECRRSARRRSRSPPPAASTKVDAAGRRHAGQGFAGQADAHAATSRIARHLEIELRVSARHQERQRQEADREPVGAGAAEFRCHVHRAIRQPGAQRRAGRCRPDQGRQAQGARRRTPRRPASYKVMARVAAEDASATTELSLDITGQPKLDISGREGLVSTRATAGKETIGAGRHHQYRHCAGRRDRAQRLGAERLEDHLRSEDRSTASRRTRTRKCRR